MGRSSRKTKWVDAVQTGALALPGAAAPGFVVNSGIVTEAEAEDFGRPTVIRIVGDMYFEWTQGRPVITATIFRAFAYVGATNPTDWDQDTFENPMVMATRMFYLSGSTNEIAHWSLDVRTKRILGPGHGLNLAIQNHSIANHDANYAYHLRALLLLP